MITKTSFAILFLFICSNLFAQDCDRFRTGKFGMETHGVGMITIERGADYEHIYPAGKIFEVHYSIKWISDCKYVETVTKVVNLKPEVKVGTRQYVEITKTYTDGYLCILTDEDGNKQTLRYYTIQ